MKAWSLSFPSTAPCIAPKLPFFYSLPPLTSPKRRRPASLPVLSASDDSSSHKNNVLLSTTELSDGSFVFRFGDASELIKRKEVVSTSQDNVKSQKEDKSELLDVKLNESGKDLVETINYKVKTPRSVAKLDNSVQLEKKNSTSIVEQVVELKQKRQENSISKNVTVIEQDGEENDSVNDVGSDTATVMVLVEQEEEENNSVKEVGRSNVTVIEQDGEENNFVNDVGSSQVGERHEEEKNFVNNVVSSRVVELDEDETSTSNVKQVVEEEEEEAEAEKSMTSDNVFVKEEDEEDNNSVNDVASSQVIESRVLIGEAYQKDNVGEIASNLDSSVSSSAEIEVSSSFVTEDCRSDESAGLDDLLNSVAGEENNVHKEDDVVVVDNDDCVDENVVPQVIPEVSAVNAQVAVEKEVPTDNMDVQVSSVDTGSKIVADENLPPPEFREAINEGGTQNGGAGTSLLNAMQPKTTGEAIDESGKQNGDAGTSLLHGEPETTRGDVCTEELFLSSGATFLANPSKALTGREDAYFVFKNWFGIADGVRHWSFEGTINESYAHELIKNCKKIVTNNESTLMTEPAEVLSKAAEETQSNGSSTALIAYFDGQALSAANIGDSGFIIVRNGFIFKRSTPMMHEFNFPMQIERGDEPSKLVQIYKTDLEEGDVIITASDGLFDNVYDQEIISFATKSLQSGSEPQDISELLARRALEVGQTALARSPFGDAAQAAGYAGYSGGKLDDVTVIVSLVKNRSSTSSLSQ